MRDWIAQENIARYEKLLAETTDPDDRAHLSKLLKLERVALSEFIASREETCS